MYQSQENARCFAPHPDPPPRPPTPPPHPAPPTPNPTPNPTPCTRKVWLRLKVSGRAQKEWGEQELWRPKCSCGQSAQVRNGWKLQQQRRNQTPPTRLPTPPPHTGSATNRRQNCAKRTMVIDRSAKTLSYLKIGNRNEKNKTCLVNGPPNTGETCAPPCAEACECTAKQKRPALAMPGRASKNVSTGRCVGSAPRRLSSCSCQVNKTRCARTEFHGRIHRILVPRSARLKKSPLSLPLSIPRHHKSWDSASAAESVTL